MRVKTTKNTVQKELALLREIVDNYLILTTRDSLSGIVTHTFKIKGVPCTILSSPRADGLFGFSFCSALNQVDELLRIMSK